MDTRVPTPQGITVHWLLRPQMYQAYCNDCPWVESRKRRNLGAAQQDARRHAKKCEGKR